MARRRISLATRRIRTESDQTIIVDRQSTQPSLVAAPIVETDFAQLEDGTMIELIEDPIIASQSLLAVSRNGSVSFLQQMPAQGQLLVPLVRGSEILKMFGWHEV